MDRNYYCAPFCLSLGSVSLGWGFCRSGWGCWERRGDIGSLFIQQTRRRRVEDRGQVGSRLSWPFFFSLVSRTNMLFSLALGAVSPPSGFLLAGNWNLLLCWGLIAKGTRQLLHWVRDSYEWPSLSFCCSEERQRDRSGRRWRRLCVRRWS